MGFKPESYSSVSPYLIVPDIRAMLAFLGEVFAGERLRFMERSDGSVEHAEYRIDDTVIMFGEAPIPDGVQAHVHIYCPDPDGVFQRADAAGATVIDALEDREDGDRRGGFEGPPGVVWWVARQLSG